MHTSSCTSLCPQFSTRSHVSSGHMLKHPLPFYQKCACVRSRVCMCLCWCTSKPHLLAMSQDCSSVATRLWDTSTHYCTSESLWDAPQITSTLRYSLCDTPTHLRLHALARQAEAQRAEAQRARAWVHVTTVDKVSKPLLTSSAL